MTTKNYSIATIPGDGIGPEVIRETKKVLQAGEKCFGYSLEWKEFPCSVDHYLATGEILTPSMLQEMQQHDALLLGAIGDPRVKPGTIERGILLTLRFELDQYINLRPAKSFARTPLPVKLPEGEKIDILVVRENTEDFYMGIGAVGQKNLTCDLATTLGLYSMSGSCKASFDKDIRGAIQIGIATEPGIRRVTAWACKAAQKRGESGITLASKSNALPQIYGFWEEIARDEAALHNIDLAIANVDALCYHLVRTPQKYGVILTPNMFGDIVSDLLGAIAGGLGIAAGANIGDGLSMFEPVHGSAPDIAGTGKASPVAAILSGALLLDHLGLETAAQEIEKAVATYLETASSEDLPMEMGGKASTEKVGNRIAAILTKA